MRPSSGISDLSGQTGPVFGHGRIIGWLVAALVLALLQACSAVKLAYNNAPEFAYWWLDGYADFSEGQSPKARDELARLLNWHRTEELPKLADMLQRAQRLAAADLTPRRSAACSRICAHASTRSSPGRSRRGRPGHEPDAGPDRAH